MPQEESARIAYDHYAPIYDEWNAQNNYEMWLGDVLLPELEKHGLRKGWALDAGCGTGRAFEPLLDRGWQVVGSDVSGGMLAEAERNFGSRVRLIRADARELPPIVPSPGSPATEGFQLVLLLNDVVNYLTQDGDLERVFAGVKRNLSPEQGLVVFDANTLSLFRDSYASGASGEIRDRGWEWQGLSRQAESGATFEGRLSGRGVETHVHRQRHWTFGQVKAALEAAGLTLLASLGQREEGGQVLLSSSPDEERDSKVIYIAGHEQRDD
jgi:SAM-dependent methyltransferase